MEFRPYYFAREWVRAGHHVTIIGSSFSHLRSTQPICDNPVSFEEIDGIRYIWFRAPRYSGNSYKRIVNMLIFSMQLLGRDILTRNPDVVIDSSTYPLTIWGSRKIAKRFNAKLIFEVHDLWPLTPMELGGYSRWHPFIFILQHAENYAYKNADKVVSLLPCAKEHMISHGMHPEKFAYIPNGIDLHEWQETESLPSEHHAIIKQLKAQEKFIVGYAGSIGLANALDYLFEAAALLKNEKSLHFILVGQGPHLEQLKTAATAKSIDNITFLSPIQKKQIPTLFSLMDALYIGWKKKSIYRFGISPNKLLDYMMAAKPIIHAVEAANDPVAEAGCGLSIAPEDPKAIVRAVKQIMAMSPGDRAAMGERGRKYVIAHHDYRVLAKRFLEVI